MLYDIVFRVQLGEAPLVKTAASVFQELCYNYRDQLTAGIICAGWDKRNGGQVYSPNSKKNCFSFNQQFHVCQRFITFLLEACVSGNHLLLVVLAQHMSLGLLTPISNKA